MEQLKLLRDSFSAKFRLVQAQQDRSLRILRTCAERLTAQETGIQRAAEEVRIMVDDAFKAIKDNKESSMLSKAIQH